MGSLTVVGCGLDSQRRTGIEMASASSSAPGTARRRIQGRLGVTKPFYESGDRNGLQRWVEVSVVLERSLIARGTPRAGDIQVADVKG